MNRWEDIIKRELTGKRVMCINCGKQRLSSSAVSQGSTQCATCNRRFGKDKRKSFGGRPKVKKNLNVDIARHILAGPPDNNDDENYDRCCEHSREAMENQLREYGDIGTGVLESPEWRNYNCANLRTELELWSAMDMPGMQQIVEAWDKCAEMGGANDLV